MEIQTPFGRTFIDSDGITAKIIWNPGFENAWNRRYFLGSPVQIFIDEQFMQSIQPYMPLKTGTMINSMLLATVAGTGEVRVRTPYARRQYFEGREAGETQTETLHSQTGALRGRLWVPRWKADNWTAFMNSVRRFNMSN